MLTWWLYWPLYCTLLYYALTPYATNWAVPIPNGIFGDQKGSLIGKLICTETIPYFLCDRRSRTTGVSDTSGKRRGYICSELETLETWDTYIHCELSAGSAAHSSLSHSDTQAHIHIQTQEHIHTHCTYLSHRDSLTYFQDSCASFHERIEGSTWENVVWRVRSA